MTSISRKPVPPARNHPHVEAYSYAAAPSNVDDHQNDASGCNTERLQLVTNRESRYKSEPIVETIELQALEHQETSPWGIHWKSPALMLGLFLLGIASSIGHHVFYQSLDNTNVDSTMSQEWALRTGTGLAFMAKTSLAASIGVAYTQRLWVTLRKRPISMQAVDDLFLLTVDPTAFFSSELFRMAKVLCLMAASMWCVPIIATITPATLSVNAVITQSTVSMIVPYLDFDSNARHFYNDIGNRWLGMGQPISTISLRRLLSTVATGGHTLQVTPSWANSTFEMDFFGPSLKCFNLSAPTQDPAEDEELALMQAMFNYTINATKTDDFESGGLGRGVEVEGQLFYWGFYGEYLGAPIPPSIQDRSELRDIFHIRLHEPDRTKYVDSGFMSTDFSCSLWNTSYHVLFQSTQGDQSSTITRAKRTNQIHIDGNTDRLSQYTQSERAYKGYSSALRLFLHGRLGRTLKGEDLDEIEMATSSLTFCPELVPAFSNTRRAEEPWLCRNGSMLKAVEDLAQNFTLSLLSSPALSGNTTVTAQVFKSENRYAYNWRNLVAAYGAGVVVALFGVLVGGFSYWANGYSASTSFSRIMMTTRNADLDLLAKGRCLPTLPLGKKLGKVKLRYGLLRSAKGGEHEHAAFGFAGTVTELQKGTMCA